MEGYFFLLCYTVVIQASIAHDAPPEINANENPFLDGMYNGTIMTPDDYLVYSNLTRWALV